MKRADSKARGEALVRALVSVLVATVLLFAVHAARAETRSERRVVIVNEPSAARFLERVRAELAGLGLVVVIEDYPGPLEAAARTHNAVAAIRLAPGGKGVEVWMADETSGRSLLRQVIVDETPGGPDEGLVALQTAELLRTSLLLDGEPRAEAEPKRESGGSGLQAALGALYSPGGGDSALQLWISLHTSLESRFGLALDLSAPLRAASFAGPEGSAELSAYLAAAALVMRLQDPGSRWFATVGLGAGAARLIAEGRATEPLVSKSESQVTGVGYARADAGYEFTPWLRAGGRGVVGSALDRVSLRFAGSDAGSWGRSFFGALAMAEVRWH